MQLIHGECLKEMGKLLQDSIDLTITSPPYDNLRTYNDMPDWSDTVWKPIIAELYRVTKQGGIVVWVVSDATIKGSETGTSFRQALYAMDCGFNLHDTMIYKKQNPMPKNKTRYEDSFEYMFIFTKGKIATHNIKTEACKRAGEAQSGRQFKKDGTLIPKTQCGRPTRKTKIKTNIWSFAVGNVGTGHPAVFPESLAHDHIISWSNPGDLVLDPFMGSGTTGAMCVKTDRDFIGIERDDQYFAIAQKRIADEIKAGVQLDIIDQ